MENPPGLDHGICKLMTRTTKIPADDFPWVILVGFFIGILKFHGLWTNPHITSHTPKDSIIAQMIIIPQTLISPCHYNWATKKTLITYHYTGWFIGILIMAYYNPYITGFLTFDLSTRETSCTINQHLRDHRAHPIHNWVGCHPLYGGFLKWWYPQNTPKWSFLVGKPMVVGETHHFRKPPKTLKQRQGSPVPTPLPPVASYALLGLEVSRSWPQSKHRRRPLETIETGFPWLAQPVETEEGLVSFRIFQAHPRYPEKWWLEDVRLSYWVERNCSGAKCYNFGEGSYKWRNHHL